MRVLLAIKFSKSSIVCLSLVTLSASFGCRSAEGQQQAQLLKTTYANGDYYATIRLATDIVNRQPNDALAHYYLGSAAARLGMVDSARKAFAKCQTLGKGTELGKLAERAIAALSPYDLSPDKNKVDPVLSVSNSQERQRLLAEQDKEMKDAEKRFDESMSRLQKTFTGDQLKSASQKEFEVLSKEQASITERYQRRADSLLRRGTVPYSNGQSAIAPSSSNPNHVQNYVNPGDPSRSITFPTENPMQAQALKMGAVNSKPANTGKVGQSKNGSK